MRTILLSIFFYSSFFSTLAQTVNYGGLFPTIDHSADINKRFSYNVYIFDAVKPYNSTVNNYSDEARSLYFYTEAGISYTIIKQLSFTASYVHERQNPFKTYYREENRAFQQLTLKLPIGKCELKQRLRFDERFVQNRTTGEASLTHRLRYLLGVKVPFKNDKMYFFAYSEAFFNTTPNATFIFNENWSAAQLGFKINNWSSFETGLLYVGWINNAQKDWLNQFYLQLTWATHFNFRKKG